MTDKKNNETDQELENNKSESKEESTLILEKSTDSKENEKVKNLVKTDPEIQKVMDQLKNLSKEVMIEKPKEVTKEESQNAKNDNKNLQDKEDEGKDDKDQGR